MDLEHFFQTLGPYSAPINVVLFSALVWLSKDRTRILSELKESQAEARELRERRVEDLREQADEYLQHSVTTQEALQKWTEVMRAVLHREAE